MRKIFIVICSLLIISCGKPTKFVSVYHSFGGERFEEIDKYWREQFYWNYSEQELYGETIKEMANNYLIELLEREEDEEEIRLAELNKEFDHLYKEDEDI